MSTNPALVGRVLRDCVDSDGVASPGLRSLVSGHRLDGLPDAAAFHGVDGFAYRALRDVPGADPDAVGRLEHSYRQAIGSHLRTLGDLEVLGDVLDSAGIPWLVVKGPVLSEVVYPRPDLRVYADLDLVVPGPALRDAIAALEDGGCRIIDRNWPLVRELVPGELHLAAPYGTFVDLHWHLLADRRLRAAFRIDMDDLFDHRRTVSLDGRKAPTAGATDTLVHLALHACLSGGNRLVWLKDVQLAIASDPPAWDEVIERARAWDVHLLVSTVLARAKRLVGADVPDGVLDALSSGGAWRALASLTDRAAPVERAVPGPSTTRLVNRATRRDGRASARALAIRSASRLAAVGAPATRDRGAVLVPAGDERDRAAYLGAVDGELGVGRRRRVAFLAQPFDVLDPDDPAFGSIALWDLEVARRLAATCDVTIYGREGAGPRPPVPGVRFVGLPARADDRVARLARLAQQAAGKAGVSADLYHRFYFFALPYYLRYAAAAGRAARDDGQDVVVISNFVQLASVVRRLHPRAHIVLSMQCDWLVEMPETLAARRLADVDAVIGCSDHVSGGVARRFPRLAGRCATVYNATDVDHFRPQGERSDATILYTGRLCEEKGAHVLLEAMPAVLEHHPDAVLVLAGGVAPNPPSPSDLRTATPGAGATYEARLRALAAPLGDRVRFTGALPHRDLAALYGSAAVFVHPASWPEPFGMTITEAMASGCPVVATSTGGIPEIVVPGESGVLVDPDQPRQLADALIDLLGDRDRRQAMGAAARRRVAGQFTWDRTAASLAAVLQRLEEGAVR